MTDNSDNSDITDGSSRVFFFGQNPKQLEANLNFRERVLTMRHADAIDQACEKGILPRMKSIGIRLFPQE